MQYVTEIGHKQLLSTNESSTLETGKNYSSSTTNANSEFQMEELKKMQFLLVIIIYFK